MRKYLAAIVVCLALVLSACGGVSGTVISKDHHPAQHILRSGWRDHYTTVSESYMGTCYRTVSTGSTSRSQSYPCSQIRTRQVNHRTFDSWVDYIPECWSLVIKTDPDDKGRTKTVARCVTSTEWETHNTGDHYVKE
jgi:hypothetical protein